MKWVEEGGGGMTKERSGKNRQYRGGGGGRMGTGVRFVTIVFLDKLLRSERETEGEGGSSRVAAT
jgi:hypothetical protein